MRPKFPPVEPASDWVVAYTNPRRETEADEAIRRRAFSTYVPVMTVTRRRATVRQPLFPRYVFVGLADGQNTFGLRGCPGLECMVRVAGRPVTVEAEMLDSLRAAEAAGVYDFTDERLAEKAVAEEARQAADAYARAVRDLQPGARVGILEGPFKRFPGTVDRLLLPDRVSVFIRLFGATHAVPMRIGGVAVLPGCAP